MKFLNSVQLAFTLRKFSCIPNQGRPGIFAKADFLAFLYPFLRAPFSFLLFSIWSVKNQKRPVWKTVRGLCLLAFLFLQRPMLFLVVIYKGHINLWRLFSLESCLNRRLATARPKSVLWRPLPSLTFWPLETIFSSASEVKRFSLT